MIDLRKMIESARAPSMPPSAPRPVRKPSERERAWQLEWARRNREISAKLKADEAARNDVRVLEKMHTRTGAWTTRDLARALRVNADWLRKHPLRRLCEAGKVRPVVVLHPVTGWPLRRDWEAVEQPATSNDR